MTTAPTTLLLPLAQVVPPADDLAAFMACVTFFLLSAVAIKKLREKSPAAPPQPFLVAQPPDYVSSSQCQAHRLQHDKEAREFKDELKRHAARRAEIYDTQKEQGAQISALVERTESINATQIRQESKIDLILQRLPRT